MKRGFHTAFPTFSTYGSVASSIYNGLKKRKTGFTIFGSDTHEKKMAGYKQRKRFRGRSLTTQRRRRRFRRGNRVLKRVRRLSKKFHRKGLGATEIKYNQSGEITTNANTGANVIYGIMEKSLQVNTNAFPLSSKIACSSGINIGTGRNERIGNKIFIRHLRIRGGIWASTDANAANEVYIRIMVLRVKEAQGNPTTAVSTVPTADNVFDSVLVSGGRWDGTGVVTSWPTSGTNAARQMGNFTNTWKYLHARWGNDFQVLKSKTIKISKETGVNSEKKLFKMNIPIFKPAHWDGTTNTDAQDGHIYIYYWMDGSSQDPILALASYAATRPHMGFTWRLSYTDV